MDVRDYTEVLTRLTDKQTERFASLITPLDENGHQWWTGETVALTPRWQVRLPGANPTKLAVRRLLMAEAERPVEGTRLVVPTCGEPDCIAVDHLSTIDQITYRRGLYTHCDNGHQLTDTNTLWCARDGAPHLLYRRCRTCRNDWARATRRKAGTVAVH